VQELQPWPHRRPCPFIPLGSKTARYELFVRIHCLWLCVALAVVLLMTPAALHRLAFHGEDSPDFVTIGSVFVIAASVPLALAIAFDTYVAVHRSLESDPAAFAAASFSALLLFSLWYAYPLWQRHSPARA